MGAKPEWTLLLTALATRLCNPGSSCHFSVADTSSQVTLSVNLYQGLCPPSSLPNTWRTSYTLRSSFETNLQVPHIWAVSQKKTEQKHWSSYTPDTSRISCHSDILGCFRVKKVILRKKDTVRYLGKPSFLHSSQAPRWKESTCT